MIVTAKRDARNAFCADCLLLDCPIGRRGEAHAERLAHAGSPSIPVAIDSTYDTKITTDVDVVSRIAIALAQHRLDEILTLSAIGNAHETRDRCLTLFFHNAFTPFAVPGVIRDVS